VSRLALIIPAAGSGSRMKAELPKPFLEVNGKPILYHTLNSFGKIEGLAKVVVVVHPGYSSQADEILKSLFYNTKVSYQIAEGGKERQYSILNGLQKVEDDVELIAVHDAVRPFVDPRDVEKCCKVAAENGGAVLGVRARDTLKQVDKNNVILNTPDRSLFWQAQTPQIFRLELFKKAYETAMKKNTIATDDASLVEKIGGKVVMVEGNSLNIKITYPEDLIFAEKILQGRE